MSNKKITTQSSAHTQRVAHDIAREILASGPKKSAVIVALSGDLGAGKTTFTQGLARALGITEVVNSPTFVIMKKFQIPQNVVQNLRPQILYYKYFYHIDCYRLDNVEDILHLGFKEIISNPENIVAIEWPEKISAILPTENIILIQFDHGPKNERTLTVNM